MKKEHNLRAWRWDWLGRRGLLEERDWWVEYGIFSFSISIYCGGRVAKLKVCCLASCLLIISISNLLRGTVAQFLSPCVTSCLPVLRDKPSYEWKCIP